MAEPKFMDKNYVNEDDLITVSHGNGSKQYLFDRDNVSTWLTSGANDDATEVSIIVEFYEGELAVERDIDRALFINHNLKNYVLEYWDGAAWVELASDTTEDQDVTFLSFTEVTTTKIRLTATETQVADAEKFIGELIVTAELLALAREVEPNYEVRGREQMFEQVMGDGTIRRAVTRWAQNRVQRYEASGAFSFVSEADRADLKDIRDNGDPFLWYPESISRPDEIFYVHWTTPWTERYVTSYKGAGSEIPFKFVEV